MAHTRQTLGQLLPYFAGDVWLWLVFSLVRALPSTFSLN
jgi:hypothetical protein